MTTIPSVNISDSENEKSIKRARDLGIPFDGNPGPLNAITDVTGVEVGFETLISGSGPLQLGKGPVRTGVTAILPRGKTYDPVFAGSYAINGNGEITGITWLEESGFLEGPILITNTHSVGVVRDAAVQWQLQKGFFAPASTELFWLLPVVAETYDGFLNDVNGFHVKPEHAFAALDNARSGPLQEGNVGGGTGTSSLGFKGGTGTASRKLAGRHGGYTVGVLVQTNFGVRKQLTIAGVQVGREIVDPRPGSRRMSPLEATSLIEVGREKTSENESGPNGAGSIIAVVATDAPLLPHQLKRLTRRVPLALARVGATGSIYSGDIFVAFSTANPGAADRVQPPQLSMVPNDLMDPLFDGTVDATEEAIINALVAADDMHGRDDNFMPALPHEAVREILRKYNRLIE